MPTPQKPQSDPWQEAAKNYKPQQEEPAPTQGGNDDWKIWQQAGDIDTGDSRNKMQQAFDELATPPNFDIHHPISSAANDFGAGVFGLMSPLFHPVKTLKMAVGLGGQGFGAPNAFTKEAEEDLVKPFIKNEGESKGDYASRMTGQGISMLPSLAAPEMARDVPFIRRDPIGAYRSPTMTQLEATARSAADVLKPNPAAYRGSVNTLMEHAPAIKDFAASTGNKFRTPLDFGKAATGAGQESTNFFKEHLVEPNAEVQTRHGTIGQVYQRLSDINDELRPAYRQRTGGQELTALERKNLEAERDQLNETLYENLSGRSGMSPEDIRAINQRGGALQNLGDEADSAQALRRSGFSGYTPTGLPIPMTAMERAMRLVQYLRGGPEVAAGGKLRRIMSMVDQPAAKLPDAESIATYRRMAEQEELGHVRNNIAEADANRAASEARKPQGMGPSTPPVMTLTPDTEGAYSASMASREPRIMASARRTNATRGLDAIRAAREQELLAPARRTQSAAITLRKGAQ